MCTVTYVPQADGGFTLTSNRDVAPDRAAKEILYENGLLFPQDTQGGTWLALSEEGRLVCLLNGAFRNHARRPPYPKSRGWVVRDFFQYDNAAHFHQEYDLEGMEPFTLIIWEKGRLYQFRRDTERSYLNPLDAAGHYIWSSATLYSREAKLRRQSWFDAWWDQGDHYPASVLQLHREGGRGDSHDGYVMDRDGKVATVSISQVLHDTQGFSFSHHDFSTRKIHQHHLSLQDFV